MCWKISNRKVSSVKKKIVVVFSHLSIIIFRPLTTIQCTKITAAASLKISTTMNDDFSLVSRARTILLINYYNKKFHLNQNRPTIQWHRCKCKYNNKIICSMQSVRWQGIRLSLWCDIVRRLQGKCNDDFILLNFKSFTILLFFFLRCLPGLFPAQHPKTNRVSVFARWQVLGHTIESKSLPILPLQKVLDRWNEPRL